MLLKKSEKKQLNSSILCYDPMGESSRESLGEGKRGVGHPETEADR